MCFTLLSSNSFEKEYSSEPNEIGLKDYLLVCDATDSKILSTNFRALLSPTAGKRINRLIFVCAYHEM